MEIIDRQRPIKDYRERYILPSPRWVSRIAIVYSDSTCQLCGVHYGENRQNRACPVSTCLACKSPQCLYNGLGRGQCSLCLIGLLDGYAIPACGYARCTSRAILAAPRVHYACRHHAEKKGLVDKALQYLSERQPAWHLVPFAK